MKLKPATTCQICARPIHANTGLIAHHGYTRPHRGSGWQTSSCSGARHVPYEQGHDALDIEIPRLTAWIARRKDWLADFIAHPPATLTVEVYQGAHKDSKRIEVTRPDGFSSDNSWGRTTPRSYAYAYFKMKDETEMQLRFAADDLAFLKKRRAAWTAPVAPAAAAPVTDDSALLGPIPIPGQNVEAFFAKAAASLAPVSGPVTREEADLLTLAGLWSGVYIPATDAARLALASGLEARGLVTIDRRDSTQICVSLVTPPPPAPMPQLTVLPPAAPTITVHVTADPVLKPETAAALGKLIDLAIEAMENED